MSTLTYYHGTTQPAAVLDAIIGGGSLRDNFHMTPDPAIAAAYGSAVIAIEFESDLKAPRIGRIEKDGNHNAMTGHGIEVVLDSAAAKREFFTKLWDAKRVH